MAVQLRSARARRLLPALVVSVGRLVLCDDELAVSAAVVVGVVAVLGAAELDVAVLGVAVLGVAALLAVLVLLL